MATTTNTTRIELLAEEILNRLKNTTEGHCARVDFFTRQVAEELCSYLSDKADKDSQLMLAILTHDNIPEGSRFYLNADEAIEKRNLKSGKLLLFVPSDIVDSKASSLTNSFEAIDGRNVYERALHNLRTRLEASQQAILKQIDAELRPPLRVSITHRFDFACFLKEAKSGELIGKQLWRIGLIPDNRPDFLQDIRKNRECVIKLSYPGRSTATLNERIQDLKVSPSTATDLLKFFRNQQLYNPLGWTKAVVEDGSKTFDQWEFPESQQSNLESIHLKDFLKPDGTVEAYCKLKLDEKGDNLFGVCDEKGLVVVKWTTVPAKPSNIGRWLVELTPFQNEAVEFDIELPSLEINDPAKREAKIKLSGINLEEQSFDSSFCVRVTALDNAGNSILEPESKSNTSPTEITDTSRDFFLTKDLVSVNPSATGGQSQRTVETIAVGRLEAILDGGAKLELSEDNPQWMTKEQQYFSLRLNDRRVIHLGFSSILVDLERAILKNPNTGGRYRLKVEEIQTVALSDTVFKQQELQTGNGRSWESFWQARRDFFKLLADSSTRNLVSVADWNNKNLVNSAEKYTEAYSKLLNSLLEVGADKRNELGAALSVDTLSVEVGEQCNPAVITLPMHPLRVAWLLEYNRKLAEWEAELKKLDSKERKTAFDRGSLQWLTPLNLPAFSFNGSDGEFFVFFQNLQFFYGVAFPPQTRDPQRRFDELATIFGVNSPVAVGNLTPAHLTRYLEDYLNTHSYLDTLAVTLINPARGDFFAEAVKGLLEKRGSEEGESETKGAIPAFQLTSYIPGNDIKELSGLEQLRSLQNEGLKASGTDAFLPSLTNSIHNLEALEAEKIALPQAHLTIVTDLSVPTITALSVTELAGKSNLSSSINGLIQKFEVVFGENKQNLYWDYFVQTSAKVDNWSSSVLNNLVQNWLLASGLLIAKAKDHLPILRVEVSHEQRQLLEQLHNYSDWVITADRFLGFEFYDAPLQGANNSFARKYLLAYSPELAEGLGHRLMITTTWREELSWLLNKALVELGFIDVDKSVGRLLHYLKTVSGKLLFQTPAASTQAGTAVGLGVVTAWLENQGRLSDAILVPVDLNSRLFTRQKGSTQGSSNRRCDLVLFKPTADSLEISFLEVKWRSGQAFLESLIQDMTLQMETTEQIFGELFANNRVDNEVQRVYLANILRFYLSRAERYGLIKQEVAEEFRQNLLRLEQVGLQHIPKLEGYVVNLNGEQRDTILVRQAVIRFLTTQDFEPTDFSVSLALPSSQDLTLTVEDKEDQNSSGEADSIIEAESNQSPPNEAMPANSGNSSQDSSTSSQINQVQDEETDINAQLTPSKTASSEREAPVEQPVIPANQVVEVKVALGELNGTPLVWQPSVKGSPHLFIIGIPGQGKSWTITRILSELSKQAVPALVLDFHGQFADSESSPLISFQSNVIDVAQGLPFSPFEFSPNVGAFGWKAASQAIAEIFGYVTDLGDIQRDAVYTSVLEAYEARGFKSQPAGGNLQYPTLADVLQRLERKEREGRTSNVIARSRPLLEMDLFHPQAGGKSLLDSVREGLIVDLHNLQYSEKLQLAAGAFILRKIYTDMINWKQADRLRLVIVLDEAHRLARDITLPKIMKEGRKFGIAVVVASQGLSDFHQDVLGNAGTKVIFRVNYPESRKVANYIKSQRGQDLTDSIEQLNVGNAYVQTPEMPFGSRIKMYPPQ